MRISALIEELMDIQAQYGDETVFYVRDDVSEPSFCEVVIVKVDKDPPGVDVILS